mmetsp:Transcript_19222/g.53555  ORF Transcript_19222/g.53555 Transcript_19222/m.53555 type:complete len:152 (+) Transcript_19222:791-1246(+)
MVTPRRNRKQRDEECHPSCVAMMIWLALEIHGIDENDNDDSDVNDSGDQNLNANTFQRRASVPIVGNYSPQSFCWTQTLFTFLGTFTIYLIGSFNTPNHTSALLFSKSRGTQASKQPLLQRHDRPDGPIWCSLRDSFRHYDCCSFSTLEHD